MVASTGDANMDTILGWSRESAGSIALPVLFLENDLWETNPDNFLGLLIGLNRRLLISFRLISQGKEMVEEKNNSAPIWMRLRKFE